MTDIFDSKIVPLLEAALGLRAVTFFEEIRWRHPDLDPGIRRTLERQNRSWQAIQGPDQEVIFRPMHEPGRMGLSAAFLDLDVDARANLTLRYDALCEHCGPII